jgi:hypothetical protein
MSARPEHSPIPKRLFHRVFLKEQAIMARVTYEIVEHDGGWAYRVGEVLSETFASHDQAREAAEIAAAEQTSPGSDETIEYEDEKGVWHEEEASGKDRPQTDVEG